MSSHRTRGHQAGDQEVADGGCPPMEEAGGTPPPRSEKAWNAVFAAAGIDVRLESRSQILQRPSLRLCERFYSFPVVVVDFDRSSSRGIVSLLLLHRAVSASFIAAGSGHGARERRARTISTAVEESHEYQHNQDVQRRGEH